MEFYKDWIISPKSLLIGVRVWDLGVQSHEGSALKEVSEDLILADLSNDIRG